MVGGKRLSKMFPSWEAKLLVPPHWMTQRRAAAVFFPGKASITVEVIACQEQKSGAFIRPDWHHLFIYLPSGNCVHFGGRGHVFV